MSNLNVPYVSQAGETHCGAACLEMVYRFLGITDTSQEKIWQKRKILRPDGSADYIPTQGMVDDAVNKGLYVLVGQICLEVEKCNESLRNILVSGLPVIAGKQWTKNPTYGHFVVVIGLKYNHVVYLDPELNQKPQEKRIGDFISEWQHTTGEEVVDGRFLVVGQEKEGFQFQKIHLTHFFVPVKLKSFCLESIELSN